MLSLQSMGLNLPMCQKVGSPINTILKKPKQLLRPYFIMRITGRVKDLFKTGKGKYVAPAPIEDKLAMHPAVEACCVAGAGLGQPLGIVMLAADAVAQAQDPAARQALERDLDAHRQAINAHLDPHEQLQALVLVSTPWTVDNDMITPTLKVKRNRIDEVYGPRFEAWENLRRPIVWADH